MIDAMTLITTSHHNGRITIYPDICNGRPVIRGLPITVETVLGFLIAGDTPEDLLQQYPMLEAEDIPACPAFATRLLSHRYTLLKAS
jgi:uncharacterized protein (DUF433 family)